MFLGETSSYRGISGLKPLPQFKFTHEMKTSKNIVKLLVILHSIVPMNLQSPLCHILTVLCTFASKRFMTEELTDSCREGAVLCFP